MSTITDQYSDPGFTKLAEIHGHDQFSKAFEAAFVRPPPNEYSYAWKEAQAFPVHTPEDAVFSLLYAVKQAEKVPGEVFSTIKEAVTAYGLDPVMLVQEAAAPPRVKEASVDEYLLPERKRLRIKEASDVPLAVHALEQYGHQLDVVERTTAATRLVEKAAAFQLPGSSLPNDVYKYAGMTECNPELLVEWIGARAQACFDPEKRAMFDQISVTVQSHPKQRDRTELIKIAQLIAHADKEADLEHHYGVRLLDPVLSVFNTEKIAMSGIDMGGQFVDLHKLMAIPPEMYADVLGDDFVAQVSDETGQLSPEMLEAVLPTLPADMKQQLMAAIAPYLA